MLTANFNELWMFLFKTCYEYLKFSINYNLMFDEEHKIVLSSTLPKDDHFFFQ